MSGFDTHWLDLREAADHAARNGHLRKRAIDHVLKGGGEALVVDLGSGTGSTFRALSPAASHWRWRLVDNDPRLLSEARHRHDHAARIEYIEAHLGDTSAEVFSNATLVTASALFDLVSESFLARLVAQLSQTGAGLYSALNYDGVCRWDDVHPLDEEIVAAFNSHQRRDKGFGPSLGPSAAPVLRSLLEDRGFHVTMAASPWRLEPGQTHADLQRQFISGMATAVIETGIVREGELFEWRSARLERLESSGCLVGHWDLLALL